MIVEYDLIPYPRKLWIVKDEDFDKIKTKFSILDSDIEDINEEIDEYNGFVLTCCKNKYKGYLVFLNKEYDNQVLVHEALHVSLTLFADCGIEISPNMDQEPLCYLTEYIFNLLARQNE